MWRTFQFNPMNGLGFLLMVVKTPTNLPNRLTKFVPMSHKTCNNLSRNVGNFL